MKLVNQPAEVRAVVSICKSPTKLRYKLLANLNETHFDSDIASRAFSRISTLARKRATLVSWEDLCEDPTLPDATKAALRNAKVRPIKTDKDMSSLVENLTYYRKCRLTFEAAQAAITSFQTDAPNVDNIVVSLANAVTAANTSMAVDSELLVFGKGSNSKEMIDELLDGEAPEVIPLGFSGFDDRNGGLFPGSLVIVAGPSGGGKSLTAGQMAINFTEGGYSTAIVPLEMTKREQTARIVANLADIPVNKILTGKLTLNEKKKIRKSMKDYERRCKKLGSSYAIYEPEEDVTIENVLGNLRPFGHRVVIIDYVGLLDGVDGDDSWRQLGKAARYAKIWAKQNNVLVILLAQAAEDGTLRYSKVMTDHANNAFVWVTTEEMKDHGIIRVMQPKARNHDPAPFYIKMHWGSMKCVGLTDQEAEEQMSASGHRNVVNTERRGARQGGDNSGKAGRTNNLRRELQNRRQQMGGGQRRAA
ncbi:DnaB-like replicative helicase [Pseudomonas phage vB_PpuM-Aura]